jgi:hypothetical protein
MCEACSVVPDQGLTSHYGRCDGTRSQHIYEMGGIMFSGLAHKMLARKRTKTLEAIGRAAGRCLR